MIIIYSELKIPVNYLKQDFLDIEVKNKLAIYGDDLLLRIKEEYRYKTKQFENSFTHERLYTCGDIEDGCVTMVLVTD